MYIEDIREAKKEKRRKEKKEGEENLDINTLKHVAIYAFGGFHSFTDRRLSQPVIFRQKKIY